MLPGTLQTLPGMPAQAENKSYRHMLCLPRRAQKRPAACCRHACTPPRRSRGDALLLIMRPSDCPLWQLANTAVHLELCGCAGPFYKSVAMLKNIVTFHELANQVRCSSAWFHASSGALMMCMLLDVPCMYSSASASPCIPWSCSSAHTAIAAAATMSNDMQRAHSRFHRRLSLPNPPTGAKHQAPC